MAFSLYSHSSNKTQNHRKLEIGDSKNNILTNRKRDGHVQQKLDCKRECSSLSYKASSRGSSEKTYLSTVKYTSEHSHELYSNPFAYKIHLKGTSEYQQLTNKSLNARITAVPYSVQRRVLDHDGLSITIDARTYYTLRLRDVTPALQALPPESGAAPFPYPSISPLSPAVAQWPCY
jgi:hypothetical protein